MKRDANCGQKRPWKTQPNVQAGASSLEMIMAFTLLGSVLACSTPLIVRHQRLVAGQREYRLALDEVSNQLQRLSTLNGDDLISMIPKLQPSEFASARLPGARLRGEVQALEVGHRVQLSLFWGDEQRSAAPVTLTAWFGPERATSSVSLERRTR